MTQDSDNKNEMEKQEELKDEYDKQIVHLKISDSTTETKQPRKTKQLTPPTHPI